MVDSHGGLAWWTRMVDSHGGLARWTRMVDSHGGLAWWTRMMDSQAGHWCGKPLQTRIVDLYSRAWLMLHHNTIFYHKSSYKHVLLSKSSDLRPYSTISVRHDHDHDDHDHET